MDERLSGLEYRHVDVFSGAPLSGNGLTVFPEAEGLDAEAMQGLTQEMRQFESIFLSATSVPRAFGARIFTMEEELDFAGHPVLGAACVLHERLAAASEEESWELELNAKTVGVRTARRGARYRAVMDQGSPTFGRELRGEDQRPLLEALGLTERDLADGCPLRVVSTGLPYLIVPVSSGLERAGIGRPRFEGMLDAVGAKFVYVLDVGAREGRTWDNDGRVEDVATGSAAGPAGAYLVERGAARVGERIVLRQGGFVGRPSEIRVVVRGSVAEGIGDVEVGGDVSMVARGRLDGPEHRRG